MSDQLPPWTEATMRELYRQSRWTRFYAVHVDDVPFFRSLIKQGKGTGQMVDTSSPDRPEKELTPCFRMSEVWIRELEVGPDAWDESAQRHQGQAAGAS